MVGLAGVAFIAIFFFSVPFPVIIFGAAIIGILAWLPDRGAPASSSAHVPSGRKSEPAIIDRMLDNELPERMRPSVASSLRVSALWLALWPLGGLLATWVTFTPCFLWIFLGAPFVETLRANKAVGAAFSAITAAVVGVVLNLAVWFAIHNMFRETIPVRAFPLSFDAPDIASVDAWALVLSLAAAIAIFRFGSE